MLSKSFRPHQASICFVFEAKSDLQGVLVCGQCSVQVPVILPEDCPSLEEFNLWHDLEHLCSYLILAHLFLLCPFLFLELLTLLLLELLGEFLVASLGHSPLSLIFFLHELSPNQTMTFQSFFVLTISLFAPGIDFVLILFDKGVFSFNHVLNVVSVKLRLFNLAESLGFVQFLVGDRATALTD